MNPHRWRWNYYWKIQEARKTERLSPKLFIIAALESVAGIRVCDDEKPKNYPLFAEDIILLGNSNAAEEMQVTLT